MVSKAKIVYKIIVAIMRSYNDFGTHLQQLVSTMTSVHIVATRMVEAQARFARHRRGEPLEQQALGFTHGVQTLEVI
jgi:hypothetical protein